MSVMHLCRRCCCCIHRIFLVGTSRITITSDWKRDTAAAIYSLPASHEREEFTTPRMWGKQLRSWCHLLLVRVREHAVHDISDNQSWVKVFVLVSTDFCLDFKKPCKNKTWMSCQISNSILSQCWPKSNTQNPSYSNEKEVVLHCCEDTFCLLPGRLTISILSDPKHLHFYSSFFCMVIKTGRQT